MFYMHVSHKMTNAMVYLKGMLYVSFVHSEKLESVIYVINFTSFI